MLISQHPEVSVKAGLDPDVGEAAALAHDLGHPPFGHVGEDTLHELVVGAGDKNGFEGNAQSFRILTKLVVRFGNAPGLDLCRATLAACLKYPWLRDESSPTRSRKWGAYDIDKDDFIFARAMHTVDCIKTVEAQLMDWVDDIAYSVHDLEDFHRCGAIPWMRILQGDRTELLVQGAVEAWFDKPPDAEGRLRRALLRMRTFFFDLSLFKTVLNETYEGARNQRYELRLLTSSLIGRYICATTLAEANFASGQKSLINVADNEADEVKLLKQITRDFVISTPALLAQQHGQKQIIRSLFNMIADSSQQGPPKWIPSRLKYLWESDILSARFAADCIASLTESEVVGLNARLQGWSSGSVLDPIVR